MGEGARKRIDSITNIGFRRRLNETIFPSYLTLPGNEFHRVGAATEKARVPLSFSPEECLKGYY